MRMVLLGPPGAGKGTQATTLAARYAMPHISTGDMMRSAVSSGSELGVRVKSFLDSGALVPDEVIIEVVRDRLLKDDCASGFLLDGFPRTVKQAEALESVLSKLGLDLTHVLELNVPEDVLMNRLLSRGQKEGRPDDAENVIRERLRVYREQTLPVSSYYASSGRLVTIPGVGGIDEISARIDEMLGVRGDTDTD